MRITLCETAIPVQCDACHFHTPLKALKLLVSVELTALWTLL